MSEVKKTPATSQIGRFYNKYLGDISDYIKGTIFLIALSALIIWGYASITGEELTLAKAGEHAFTLCVIAFCILLFIAFGKLCIFGWGIFKKIVPSLGDEKRSFPFILYSSFLVLAAVFSSYNTFIGVQKVFFSGSESQVIYYVGPAIIALINFLIILIVWESCMLIIPREQLKKQMFMLVAVPLIAGAPIFITSTTTMVIGFAGDDAMKAHIDHSLEEYRESIKAIKRYKNEELNLATTFSKLGEHYNTLSEKEKETGSLTGVSGAGAVTLYLENSADYMEILSQNIINHNDSAKSELLMLEQQLVELHNRTHENNIDVTSKDGMTIVRTEFRLITDKMSEILDASVMDSIAFNLKSGEFLNPRTSLSNSSVSLADKQALAMEKMEALLDKLRHEVEPKLVKMQERTKPELSEYEHINLYDAVGRYSNKILLPWVVAITVDFFAWVILLIVTVVGRNTFVLPEHLYNKTEN